MESIVLVVHIVLAVGIIAFVMLQQGKGADAGASFGSGASQTVFGSSGNGNFLSRSTAILATGFFITSLGLAVFAKQKVGGDLELDIPVGAAIETPVSQTEGDAPAVDSGSVAPAASSNQSDAPNVGDN